MYPNHIQKLSPQHINGNSDKDSCTSEKKNDTLETTYEIFQNLKTPKTVTFMRHGKIEFSYYSIKSFVIVHRFLNFIKITLKCKKYLNNTKVYKLISNLINFFREKLYNKKFDSNLDYKDFDYHQFMTFLLNEADPPISKSEPGIDLRSLPREIDVIYCSLAKRSIQTAELIQENFEESGRKKPRVSTDLQNELAEVMFSKDILSFKEFNDHGGLSGCRKLILQKWYNGKNQETFEDSILRVEKLLYFLKSTSETNILLISHGWYLRLLKMYFKGEKKSLTNLTSANKILKYGHSFRVRLTDSFSPDPSFGGNENPNTKPVELIRKIEQREHMGK